MNDILQRINRSARPHPRIAIRLYRVLEKTALASSDFALALDALYQRYFILERLGEANALIDQLYNGLQLAENHNLLAQAARMQEALGRVLFVKSEYREATRFWSLATEISALANDVHTGVEARIGLAQIFDVMGDTETAIRFILDAEALIDDADEPYLTSKLALNLAAFCFTSGIGTLDSTIEKIEYALAEAQRGGIDEYIAMSYGYLGRFLLDRGDFILAESNTNTALQLATACGNDWVKAEAAATLAQIFLEQDRLDEAYATYEKMLTFSRQTGFIHQQSKCCFALSRLAENRGDLATALNYARQHEKLEADCKKLSATDQLRDLKQYDLSQKSPVEQLLDLSSDAVFDHAQLLPALQRVAEASVRILRIQFVAIWLLDDDTGHYVCRCLLGSSQLELNIGQVLSPISMPLYWQLQKDLHHPLVVHDLRLHPSALELLPLLTEANMRSLLEVPIRMHGNNVGFLSFGQSGQQRNWSREDVLFGSHLGNFAQQILSSLQHVKSQEKLEQTNDDLESRVQRRTQELEAAKHALEKSLDEVERTYRNISLLSEIGQEIAATLDREKIMLIVYEHVEKLMTADIFDIAFHDENLGVIEYPFYIEHGKRKQQFTRRGNDTNHLAVWCIRHRKEIFINDLEREYADYVDAKYKGKVAVNAIADGATGAMIYVPMQIKDRVLGLISVKSQEKHRYKQVHLDMLRTLAGFTAVAIDNADAYQKLQGTQQQLILQEKMASLGVLTAGVAHEINNPANFAHVGAQALGSDLERFRHFLIGLAGDDAEPEVLESLNERINGLRSQVGTVVEGTTRIRNLVLDLRTFSRLDQAQKKEILIGDSLLSTINLVRTKYAETTEILWELKDNPVLECFPAELNQVFMNLIVNACQAIQSKQQKNQDATPGLLTIRSSIERGWLMLEFEDNGCGIPKATMDHIFEPFFTTKTVGEGTGLGLSISFGIIERHLGSINVQSVEGEGTCFTIMLPLSNKAPEAA